MKLQKTKIPGPKIIKSKIFKDKRGYLRETFRNRLLKNLNFPFDVMSFSKKNVLRGLHIQIKNNQAKIITVTHGKIFDVAVDLRKKSKTFGKYFSIKISQDSNFSLFIPENFAHGFLCLSKFCAVYYKCTNYRDKNSETTIKWNDKKLNIKWPIKNPILSNKDRNGIDFEDFK